MDNIIDAMRLMEGHARGRGAIDEANMTAAGARRLEECRALLQRLANDEPAPEGHTFQSWARELLG